ncbi:SUMF1/EgtB/PvdO family nonheme iron enzyme [Akkermansiaceae bacterium]|nr:SUMF1/EgtB/PvdO family nonheme iron enzyme [Akkermansiaceae bacterium]MDB4562396.1 SUMF1/EgtB/PvdO family nonheme iron enzyme [Akkermansiaceae bacterium]
MKTLRAYTAAMGAIALGAISFSSSASAEDLSARYKSMQDQLRTELSSKLPKGQDEEELKKFLEDDKLDAKLAMFVVLHEATPEGLAEYAEQGQAEALMVETLLKTPDLMKEMLVADGANSPPVGRGFGPAQYGPATKIYADIHKASKKAPSGVLKRLALAISLEHAVPIIQRSAVAQAHAPKTIDPVKRYLHYEKAFEDGELDPAFDKLSVWELRMVVDGEEPDEILAWGREMLRNYRPDHIYNSNYGWRYVGIVTSDVKYGSGDVKHDRPELQFFQNILMNGGVCGRRAFFGRFILRAFGIPTTARPSKGHAALGHWTPEGWVVNLGGGWGGGWTKTRYNDDLNFLATTQARVNPEAFLKVKRAQWIGDVLGETRTYDEAAESPALWYGLSLKVQREIIEESKAVTLMALGEELGESDKLTVAQKVMSSPVTPEEKEITIGSDGSILIPAASYTKPTGNQRDVAAMKNFDGGLQIFLPRFFPTGTTIMRGGTWKGDPNACSSGFRMLSGGYGRYENWGLRAAMTHPGGKTPEEVTLDLGDGVKMEMIYIKPGTFEMGGESEKDGRFECVELPKHDVELTKGFYLGKYEVTQEQYEMIMGSNPSKSTKAPNCPVDTVGVEDAREFCAKLGQRAGFEVRLPTEAEWEYTSRGGRDTKWFFGDDASKLDDYAWFNDNGGGKSHPVGEKKPNQFGLYDVYGNVCERVSDTYSKNYYAKSPKADPTGPSQGTQSNLEYEVTVPRAGNYAFSAQVVTVNYEQHINVVANDSEPTVMKFPFTEGSWQESKAIALTLKKGKNALRFFRDFPPQYGVAIRSFKLNPVE